MDTGRADIAFLTKLCGLSHWGVSPPETQHRLSHSDPYPLCFTGSWGELFIMEHSSPVSKSLDFRRVGSFIKCFGLSISEELFNLWLSVYHFVPVCVSTLIKCGFNLHTPHPTPPNMEWALCSNNQCSFCQTHPVVLQTMNHIFWHSPLKVLSRHISKT